MDARRGLASMDGGDAGGSRGGACRRAGSICPATAYPRGPSWSRTRRPTAYARARRAPCGPPRLALTLAAVTVPCSLPPLARACARGVDAARCERGVAVPQLRHSARLARRGEDKVPAHRVPGSRNAGRHCPAQPDCAPEAVCALPHKACAPGVAPDARAATAPAQLSPGTTATGARDETTTTTRAATLSRATTMAGMWRRTRCWSRAHCRTGRQRRPLARPRRALSRPRASRSHSGRAPPANRGCINRLRRAVGMPDNRHIVATWADTGAVVGARTRTRAKPRARLHRARVRGRQGACTCTT